MTAVTSRLASQIDSLGECEDAGDELGDAGGDGEVPAPEENGVDDLVAVGAAPPLVVQELDGEQYYHCGQEQDCNSKRLGMRTCNNKQPCTRTCNNKQSCMRTCSSKQSCMRTCYSKRSCMTQNVVLSVERKGAVVLSTVHACSCWVDKVNYEWAYSFINDFSGKIPAFMLSSCWNLTCR